MVQQESVVFTGTLTNCYRSSDVIRLASQSNAILEFCLWKRFLLDNEISFGLQTGHFFVVDESLKTFNKNSNLSSLANFSVTNLLQQIQLPKRKTEGVNCSKRDKNPRI
uniref:Uncharacterized protein n=1 Tax=Romanomermis culicivorax TaxID=13658 RepID=A0A915JNN9_ROMCU